MPYETGDTWARKNAEDHFREQIGKLRRQNAALVDALRELLGGQGDPRDFTRALDRQCDCEEYVEWVPAYNGQPAQCMHTRGWAALALAEGKGS